MSGNCTNKVVVAALTLAACAQPLPLAPVEWRVISFN